jgi:hypothetical protein
MNTIESWPFLMKNGGVNYEFLWDDSQVRSRREGSIWRPIPPEGYANVGDVFVGDSRKEPPNTSQILFVLDQPGISAEPTDFFSLWSNYGVASNDASASLWRPIAPEGYIPMGDVAGQGGDKPDVKSVRCVNANFVRVYQKPGVKIWTNESTVGEEKLSIFSNNEFSTFTTTTNHVAFKVCPVNTKFTIRRGLPAPPKVIVSPPPVEVKDDRYPLTTLLIALVVLCVVLILLIVFV